MFKYINSQVAICMYNTYMNTLTEIQRWVRIVTRIVTVCILIVVSRERYINRGSNTYNASRDINIWYLNLDQRCNHAGAC